MGSGKESNRIAGTPAESALTQWKVDKQVSAGYGSGMEWNDFPSAQRVPGHGMAGAGCRRRPGFTLIELLVVIAIIAVLAVMVFAVATKAIRKAEKVKCLGQIREVTTALVSFATDYQSLPTPETKKNEGSDTIYGDPGGLYHTEFLVAALMGKAGNFSTGTDEMFDAAKANPKGEIYWEPVLVDDNKGGVGRKDGRYYDPWGHEMMFAINTKPYRSEDNQGRFDSRLMTWGLAEYTDTKPKDQDFVVWSYGRDGVKGKAGSKKEASVAGSDDVISW